MIGFNMKEPPRTELVTASRVVHRGPALVVALSMSGSGATPDGQVYDGVNANGVEKIDLRCVINETVSPRLGPGIMCYTGIYVAVDAVTTYLTITYYPGEELPDRE